MMELNRLIYKNALLKIKRGNKCGVFSNAKPFMVLTIIEAIGNGIILGNKIKFDNNAFQKLYQKISSSSYGIVGIVHAKVRVTPFQMPFFHLNAEEFYHLKWLIDVEPLRQASSPSAKYLRENLDYAYLDPELWDLLQNPQVRSEFRELIINHYLKPNN